MAGTSKSEGGSEAKSEGERTGDERDWMAGLPDGLKPLKSVHTEAAEELIDTADQLVALARKRFGAQTSKPRLRAVEKLFDEKAGKVPPVEKDLDEAMRGRDVVEQTAKLDQTYDTQMATAINAFDKRSIESGSSLQEGYDAWLMAKRIYQSNARAAGALFYAEIEKAKRPPGEFTAESRRHETAQVYHYTQSTAIAAALVVYEQSMATTASALAKTFGSLIAVMYKSVSDTAVAEAMLLSAANSSSLTFWSGIQKALNRPSS